MIYLILSIKILLLLFSSAHADEPAIEPTQDHQEKQNASVTQNAKTEPEAKGVYFGAHKGPLSEYLVGYEYLNRKKKQRFLKMSVNVPKGSPEKDPTKASSLGVGWGVKF